MVVCMENLLTGIKLLSKIINSMLFNYYLFKFKSHLIDQRGYDKNRLETVPARELVSKAGVFLQDARMPKRFRKICAGLLASWDEKQKIHFLSDYC